MKVLNLMWGFNLGGIGKCFLTYAKLDAVDPNLQIRTVCVNLQNIAFDLTPLREVGAETINIRNRLDISWIWKLRQMLRKYRPDVVFTHGFNGPVLMMVERLLGDRTKLLCSYHGEYHPPSRSRRLFAPLFNFAMHFCYRHIASGVLTVCECSSRFLVEKCSVPRGRVHCVHNGIPEESPDLTGSEPVMPPQCRDRFVLGLAARLDPIKGIDDLIDALSLARDLPLHLLLFGTGPSQDDLQRKTDALNLSDAVTFVGYTDNAAWWFKRLDAFVFPSHSENHAIVLLEAMRVGLPIIATDVGGNGESVRDGKEALLIPPRDPQTLAAAIRRIIADPELRRELGTNARRRFLEEFTEKKMKDELAKWLMSFDQERR